MRLLVSEVSVPMTHAIGGNVSIVGNYRVHIFTGGYSTLEIDEAGDLEYLIVAGGGAGGADHGGGGGGGQVITEVPIILRVL